MTLCGLCEVPLVDEVELEKEFCVGDSLFYKAESKVSPATITAVTDHVDGKAYQQLPCETGTFLPMSNPCFPSTPQPIPLQIGGGLVARKQCHEIVWSGVIILASWQQKLFTVPN